eukprot:Hpha_TRINITY_DN18685_c0_g1::TRINITY_DN18685_c0_g1_i1::g.115713::m.115713
MPLSATVLAPDAAASVTMPHQHTSVSSLWGVAEAAALLGDIAASLNRQGFRSSIQRPMSTGTTPPQSQHCRNSTTAQFPPAPEDNQSDTDSLGLGDVQTAAERYVAPQMPSSVTCEAISVGGAPISLERWFPAPQEAGPKALTVVDWTTTGADSTEELTAKFAAAAAPQQQQARGASGLVSVASPLTASPRRSGKWGTLSNIDISPNRHRRISAPSQRELLLAQAPWRGEAHDDARILFTADEAPGMQRRVSLAPSLGTRVTEREAEMLDKSLDLRRRDLIADDCMNLAARLRDDQQITALDLSENPRIGDQGIAYLQRAIATHSSLTRLTLAACCINDQGASLLADAVAQGCPLVELDLRWNGITKVGGRLLKKVIEPSLGCTLRHLHLGSKWIRFETNIGARMGFSVTNCGMIYSVEEDSPAWRARPCAGQKGTVAMVGSKVIPGMSLRFIGTTRVHNVKEVQRALKNQKKGVDGVLCFTVQSNRVPRKMLSRIEEKLRLAQKRTEPLSEHQSLSPGQRAAARVRSMSPPMPHPGAAVRSSGRRVSEAFKTAGTWLMSGPRQLNSPRHVNAP